MTTSDCAAPEALLPSFQKCDLVYCRGSHLPRSGSPPLLLRISFETADIDAGFCSCSSRWAMRASQRADSCRWSSMASRRGAEEGAVG